jgi:hypothetical protein
LAALVAGVLVLVLLLVVVAVTSWLGQRSRDAHDTQLADNAAWDRAVSDAAWLSSVGQASSRPRTPCSVEDEPSGHLEWTYGGSDWPMTRSSIRSRLLRQGWVEAASEGTDGFLVMSRMTSGRSTSLSLAEEAPIADAAAVLELEPMGCLVR